MYDILVEILGFGLIASIVAFFISPLQYIKIMRQDTGSDYSQIIDKTLKAPNPLKVLFRGAAPYVYMNFLTNAAFGISNAMSNFILATGYCALTGILLRSLVSGIMETVLTLYFETCEILRNKGKAVTKILSNMKNIALPIFLRNSIAWTGAAASYEISVRCFMSGMQSAVLSFVVGVLFGIISLPFDVVATQNCGSKEKFNTMQRLLKITKFSKKMLLSGTVIRVIQIGIFTVATVLTMLLFDYAKADL